MQYVFKCFGGTECSNDNDGLTAFYAGLGIIHFDSGGIDSTGYSAKDISLEDIILVVILSSREMPYSLF